MLRIGTLQAIVQQLSFLRSRPSRRRGRHAPLFPCEVRILETRTLLTSVSLNPVADGTAIDSDRDGLFDTVADTTSITDRNFDFDPSPRYEERGLFEFDLRSVAGGTISTDVSFQIYVSSFTTSGGTTPQAQVFLYSGDGTLQVGDGTVAGSLATSFTVNATGTNTILLTAAQVQPFVGGYLGIRLVNPQVNGEWFGIRSSESTERPTLTFDAEIPNSLTVSLSTDSVLENAGPTAALGTVTRTGDLSQDLLVQLSSTDPTEAAVPESIIIPAHQASATFAIKAVDDAIIDGSQTLSIQAQGVEFIDATGPLAHDDNFGTSGQQTLPTLRGYGEMARQPDGKLVVAGSAGNTQSWTVQRLLPDGTLDATFGSGGTTTTVIGVGSTFPSPKKVLIQPDGAILVIGDSPVDFGTPVAARYLPDGTLDPSFGTGGISLISSAVGFTTDAGLQSDGKILLTLRYNGTGVTFRAVRLNSDGTPDPSFGTNGVQDYGSSLSSGEALQILADDRFLISGGKSVVRCLANGNLDPTFGTGGIITLAPNGNTIRLFALAVQLDGAIVVGGRVYPEEASGTITDTNSFLARLHADGEPDLSFGSNGQVVFNAGPVSDLQDSVKSLIVQPNGKLLAIGTGWLVENDNWLLLSRWNADGTLDETFDENGFHRADYSPTSTGIIEPSALLQPDGRLVLTTGWFPHITVRRFHTATVDPLADYSASATLEVRDVEQGNTAPDLRTQTFVIPENAAVDATVAMVVATDVETPQLLEYAITAGNTGNTFTIEASTGALKVANPALLNYEVPTEFSLTIEVHDQGSPNLVDSGIVHLTLSDVNEAPTISPLTVEVAENSGVGTVVATVSATDPDTDQTLTYSIVGAHTDSPFTINPTTGLLTVNNPLVLNFEAISSIPVEIRVTDKGSPALSDTVTVPVSIKDVNEAPSVTLQNVITSLPENTNTSSPVKIADIVVTDDALGVNGLSLTGPDASDFVIVDSSLFLRSGTTLNFESKTSFHATLELDDPQFGSTPDAAVACTLTITNVNEGPALDGLPDIQAVPDTTTVSPFSSLTVFDPDTQNLFARVTVLNGVVRGDFTPASVTGWTRKVIGNNLVYERFYSPQANIGDVVQTALRNFVFQPRTNAIKPNTTELTDVTVFINDGIANTTGTTRLVTTSVNNVSAFGGLSANIPVNDDADIAPFSMLTVSDADMQEMLISVTILNGKFRGDFTPESVADWPVRYTTGNNITYKRYFSPQANVGAAAQAAFRALVFQPRTNAINPGTTELTDFQVTVSDGVTPAVLGTGTRVTTTSVNNAPVLGGAVANQTMNDNQTKAVFSTLTVTDPDTQGILARVTITNGTNRGDFTSASAVGWTRSVSGTNIIYNRYFNPTANNGAVVEAAIRTLVFQPRTNMPIAATETTSFTVFVKDGLANVTESTTSVITTGVAPRPVSSAAMTPPLFLESDITTVVLPGFARTKTSSLAKVLRKTR